VPWEWLIAEGGVQVRNLATPWGRLSYTAGAVNVDGHRGDGKGRGTSDRETSSAEVGVTMKIENGLRVPPGGIVVALPRAPEHRTPEGRKQPSRATINGRRAQLDEAGRIVVREVPATIVIRG
jgi:hypothetical protein